MKHKNRHITLLQLIKAADRGYNQDDVIEMYHRHPKGKHGDELARFIARELQETYDPKASPEDQLQEAIRVIHVATNELDDVSRSLYQLRTRT
jgi:hypothetical protein